MALETEEYEFLIRIKAVEVDLLTNSDLVLDGVKEMHLTQKNLRAVSSIEEHTDEDIVYDVINIPRHGDIVVLTKNGVDRNRLRNDGNFTQEDLLRNRVIYRLHRALFEPIHDHFQFKLKIPGDESNVFMFDIRYEPIDSDTMFVNNMLMGVQEGESKQINKEDLYMETAKYKDFSFSVIDGPQHGVLQFINPDSERIVNKNITTFSNDDIRRGKVVYKHDDSESDTDHFDFTAIPILSQTETTVQEISEFTGTFDVQILLRNDNPPQRVIEKTFNVVSNRGRLITLEDVLYRDPDVDFEDSSLQYTRRAIPNGEIVQAENHSVPLFQFTQKEIGDGKVYFKHQGANYGRAAIWVTDGQFYSTGLFEIRASDPFVRVANNSGLAVLKGGEVFITGSNISIESNLDVEDKDVKFSILEPPASGTIKKNDVEKTRFNLADIKSTSILYSHNNDSNMKDQFKFEIKIDEVTTEDVLKIKILLHNQHQAPQIINDKVLEVNEAEKVTIGKSDLLIEHKESKPRDILYTIRTHPRLGKLSLRGSGSDGSSEDYLTTFSQEDINRRKLHYTHTAPVTPATEADTFTFDVSNGVSSLRDLEFVLAIVPAVIPMTTEDVSVREGDSRVLTTDTIHVRSKYFLAQGVDFVVVVEPINGWIEDNENTGTPILQFSQEQLSNEQIYYVHDGNDTTYDEFSIMAKSMRSLNKQSNPHTIMVTVLPTNDQPPKVIANKKLEVWTGSSTPITIESLRAVDRDSGPDQLMFVISNPTNGKVVLESSPQANIVNFTQGMINRHEVLFMHQGNEKGEFEFQVNDGESYDRRRVFRVQARPLTLTLEVHEPLLVFPRIVQPFTTQHLLAKTNDKLQRQEIEFTLQSKPDHGVLVKMVNNSMIEVTRFTQNDLETGTLAYQHVTAFDGWTDYDSFIFEVSTPYAASIKFQMLDITVSYENLNADNQHQLVHVNPSSLEEGGEVTITTNNIDTEPLHRRLMDGGLRDPRVFIRISQPPKHGMLLVSGDNATIGTRFEQPDLDGGRILYEHDHSDTLWDSFNFIIDIEHHLAGELILTPTKLEVAFNISVMPINDQPFSLTTQYPYIELVQGFTANITKEILNTVDPDTPPPDITYHVQNGPTNGHLVLRDEPDIEIKTFTQQIINDNRLVFIQDGSQDSGAFYFSVSDGQFKPNFKVFTIKINPLHLELKEIKDISIIQGHSSVVLNEKNFMIETNGNRWKVFYNVTKPPMHGQLYMRDRPVRQFTQRDIDEGRVIYIQTDLAESSDHFEFILYDMQNLITTQRIDIKVAPQVVHGDKMFRAIPGEAVVLGLDALDASSLATITNSNPMYVITRDPKHGRIIKLVELSSIEGLDDGTEMFIRRKREAQKGKGKGKGRKKEGESADDVVIVQVPVKNFTHQDIANEDIMFRANNISSGGGERPDSFAYMLMARHAQPAPGEFELIITPPVGSGTKPDASLTPTKAKPAATPKPAPDTDPEAEETTEGVTKGMSKMTIIYIVAGSCAALLLLIIIIKCARKKKNKEKNKQYDMQNMPHDDSRTPLATRHVNNAGDPRSPVGDYADPRTPVDYPSPPPPIHQTPPPPSMLHPDEQYYRAMTPNVRSRSLSPPPGGRYNGYAPTPPPGGGNPQHNQQQQQQYRPPRPANHDLSKSQPLSPRTPPPQARYPHSCDEDYPPNDVPQHHQHAAIVDGSRTLPMCKVTPLGGYDDPDNTTLRRSRDKSMTPGSSKHEQVLFDWDNVDPELLQHCRKTNPVLHQDKYWV